VTAQAQPTARADSLVVARAVAAVSTFQKRWERDWISGQRAQLARMNQLAPGVMIMMNKTVASDPYKTTLSGLDARALDLDCYFNTDESQIYLSDHAWGVPAGRRSIASQINRKHWVCPNWLPPDGYYLSQAGLGDERLAIDNALEPSARQRVSERRDTLVRMLAQAVAKAPRDSLLAGQYVRALVDNDALAAALVAVDNCQARASWCLALRGFVHYRLRQTFDAEDSFLQSIDSLTPAERCASTNIGVLLDQDTRKNYTRLSCEKQDSVNSVVWWLADPLWSSPGNDRFVEQRARKVLIALHSALGRDERYNWMGYGGGDALSEMIERYGWMSYTYGRRPLRTVPELPTIYSRPPKDIAVRRLAISLGGWRTTYEYTIGRVHVIPPMSMVRDPFSITNADWSMNAPGGEWDFTFNWWPVEHYAPYNPLTRLVDDQTAFLRRQDTTLLAFATNLAKTDLARKLGDSVTGVILTSTGPRAIRRVEQKRLGAQDRLTFLAPLPRAPSLVSVEVPSLSDGERGGRSRFGVRPPPPLSAMRPEEAAMSDPVLLVVPPDAVALPILADSAIALMNGSTTLAAGTRSVGVYWETYGIAAGDSIELTVSMAPRDGGSAVTSSWREPQPGRSVRTIAGTVPVQMRSIILDVNGLPVGQYVLGLSVRRQNGQLLRTSREVTIR
jgi:hypothetical protein